VGTFGRNPNADEKKSGPENMLLIEECGDSRTGSLPVLSFPLCNYTVIVNPT
jgi:hypothetical protein